MMPQNNMQYDIFISYSSDDKLDYIDPIISRLDSLSISYWLDNFQIGWGDSILEKINSGFVSSRFILVFLSDSFLEKSWTKLELDTALMTELDTKSRILLPVLCTTKEKVFSKYPLLRSKKYFNYPLNPDELANELFKFLGRKFKTGWIFNHQKEYSGEVYIKIQKSPEFKDEKYLLIINWGPWKRIVTLGKKEGNNVGLLHTKGNDNTSIPIFVSSNNPCYITFGAGKPAADKLIDINKWWVPINLG